MKKIAERRWSGHLVVRTFRMDDGTIRSHDVWEHADVAVVLALDPHNSVILCRQFRPGQDRFVDDMPGGIREEGETPLQAAVRELREETGCEGELTQVCAYPLITNSTRVVYGFLARNCVPVAGLRLDDGEYITVLNKPLQAFVQQVADGLVSDTGVAQAALLALFVPLLSHTGSAQFAHEQLQTLARCTHVIAP